MFVLLKVLKSHLFMYSIFKNLSELLKFCCFSEYRETKKQGDDKLPIMQKVGAVADDLYIV